MRAFLAWLPVVCLSIAGCDANFNSIYRSSTFDGDEAKLVLIDAKQRSILSAEVPAEVKVTRASDVFGTIPDKNETEIVAIRRFCAEPSPDVFSVIAQSFSGGLNFGQAADPKTIEVALRAAFSSAESGSTIPRTQTINMLRELMFRTCERYLSGGYDKLELSVQAVRDQRLIVSILAIEQLTGTVTPPTVVVGAGGAAGAGGSGEAIVALEKARKAKMDAEAMVVKARSDYEKVNKIVEGVRVCENLPPEPPSPVEPHRASCIEASQNKSKAEERLREAEQVLQASINLANTAGASAATTVTYQIGDGVESGGGNVQAVVSAVKEIVNSNIDDDSEVLMFCLRALRENSLSGSINNEEIEELRSTCTDFMKQKIAAAEQEAIARAAESKANALNFEIEVEQSRKNFEERKNEYFRKFWEKYNDNNIFNDPNKREEFADDLREKLVESEKYKASCFVNSGNEEAVKACFLKLLPADQRALIR